MNERKEKNILIAFLCIAVISMSIGFASLSATLTINGSATVKQNTWDIHFVSPAVSAGSVNSSNVPTLSADNKTVTFTAGTLSNPGDFYEFTVIVQNFGSIDAEVEAVPTISGLTAAQDVYTNWTVTYADGTAIAAGDTLNNKNAADGKTATYKVRIEYEDTGLTSDGTTLPATDQVLSDLTFSVNYVQK